MMMMMIGITTMLVASTSAPLPSMRIHSPNILSPTPIIFRGECGRRFRFSLSLSIYAKLSPGILLVPIF
ncbi:hypothetical protein I7I50_00711 [Histoplasma capsulatum G186AR]|uniref:Secreted protein n=1 Tax=Ajellomyces capsulatus TaxID=5037 RepID=A0A8H8CW08_AJECA|nr:hypothetical protein I7I52_07979 [Histoplasma capsulatum]QSS72765.1 hypothetical protein I7I50_00711 [Histoplasma capsulatum G186AR]